MRWLAVFLLLIVPAHADVVLKRVSGTWTAYKADGSTLDISSSQCNGLPEAWSEAVTSGENLYVHSGTITCNAQLALAAAANLNATITADIAFGSGVTGSCVLFDSTFHSHIRFLGVISCQSTRAIVEWKPTTTMSSTIGVIDQTFEFLQLRMTGGGGGNTCGFRFTAAGGVIRGNRIYVAEIEGKVSGSPALGDIVCVSHPNETGAFRYNTVEMNFGHGFNGACARLGENTPPQNPGYIGSNKWFLNCLPLSTSAAGFMSWAKNDKAVLVLSNQDSNFATGIYLWSGSADNYIVAHRNNGSTKKYDYGTGNTVVP